jgi:hypothetical protein
MAFGVVCNAGITALINSQIAGTSFQPNVVQISSTLLACTGEETSLPNVVFTVPASSILQVELPGEILRTIVNLGIDVGNFSIATLGIFDAVSGALFALGTFPGAGQKLAAEPPTQAGNIRTLYLDLIYADVTSMFQPDVENISVITLSQMIANLSGGVTARQLRTALNNMNLLSDVQAAIANDLPSDQARIDWDTCATVTFGSALLNFIATATSQTDGGAAILAAATLLPS